MAIQYCNAVNIAHSILQCRSRKDEGARLQWPALFECTFLIWGYQTGSHWYQSIGKRCCGDYPSPTSLPHLNFLKYKILCSRVKMRSEGRQGEDILTFPSDEFLPLATVLINCGMPFTAGEYCLLMNGIPKLIYDSEKVNQPRNTLDWEKIWCLVSWYCLITLPFLFCSPLAPKSEGNTFTCFLIPRERR